MKSIEATGKTVNDAIRNGLEQLGLERDDVEIQVIEMGSPGLFGMFGKRARVRLTEKGADPALDIEMPVLTLDGGSSRKARGDKSRAEKPAKAPRSEETETTPETAESGESDEADRPAKKRRSRSRRRKSSSERAEIAEDAEETPVVESAPVIEREPFEPTPDDQLSDTARKAGQFLTGLTERMDVPVSVEIMETPEQLRMQMTGDNMSLLIGRRGETLDALQYLTSLTVNRGREDYLRISIDTENYRAKREEALRKLAVRMAGRAKKSGKRVALEPMNPYERRILHSALQNDPDVTTHSEGEEPYRRVIITLTR